MAAFFISQLLSCTQRIFWELSQNRHIIINISALPKLKVPQTSCGNWPSFNSNLVRLRQFQDCVSGYFVGGFNSNLVRLRHCPVWMAVPLSGCFNSNLVRLRPYPARTYACGLESFNSNLVRLRQKSDIRYLCDAVVSIPIWYDYDRHN